MHQPSKFIGTSDLSKFEKWLEVVEGAMSLFHMIDRSSMPTTFSRLMLECGDG